MVESLCELRPRKEGKNIFEAVPLSAIKLQDNDGFLEEQQISLELHLVPILAKGCTVVLFYI